jgi:hypothetical protein
MTMQAHLKPRANLPAALVSYGDNDLPVILGGIEEMHAHFDKVGVANRFIRVPNANHFYLRSAIAEATDGSTATLEDLIADFLYDKLGLASSPNQPGNAHNRNLTNMLHVTTKTLEDSPPPGTGTTSMR